MAPLKQFSSPANQAQIDFGSDSEGLSTFMTDWNNNLNRWSNQSIVGNPWSNTNDDNRYYYFNPLTSDYSSANGPIPITWTPFPNRLYNFFQDPNAPKNLQFSTEQIYQLADTGYVTIAGTSASLYIADLQVPQNLCPNNDWNGPLTGYTPVGPRGWLDEYCEWSVLRDQNGKIKQIMFTCENPAYWFTLWKVNPQLVLKLYQQYVNPNVQIEDLYLYDQTFSPVKDALTGYYAYNPTNKWNSGTQSLPDRGGAIHLTSGPNTLSAEIYLAAAATIARACGNSDPQTLICCAKYGRPRRNSDPHIGQLANQVAVNTNVSVTLTDPVGLYIQTPNFSRWTVKDQPDYQVQNFWQVTRGTVDQDNPGQGHDSILHAVFTVPDGLDPDDILILGSDGNQYPLQWAGQIAETFQIALRVSSLPAPAGTPNDPVPQQPRGCVEYLSNDATNLQPWPVQLLPYDMAQAGSPIDLSPDITPGTTATMLLAVQGGLQDATIEFQPSDGITATVVEFLPNGVSTPGQTSGGGTQAYIIQLSVAADAALGDRDVRVVNPGKAVPAGGEAWVAGMLSVVANS